MTIEHGATLGPRAYWYHCPCGWIGPARATPQEAQRVADDTHLQTCSTPSRP